MYWLIYITLGYTFRDNKEKTNALLYFHSIRLLSKNIRLMQSDINQPQLWWNIKEDSGILWFTIFRGITTKLC